MNLINILIIGSLLSFCFWEYPPRTLNKSSVDRPGFVMTFDDNSIREWYGVRTLLREYDIKATFFITNKNGLPDEDIEMLKKLAEDGNEIGIHGWTHSDPVEMLKNHKITDYVKTEIIRLKEYLQNNGIISSSFAYVNGIRNKKLDIELYKYFSVIRAVSESQRHSIVKDINKVDDIYYLGQDAIPIRGLCIDSLQHISIKDIQQIFDHIIQEKGIVTFYAHKPVSDSSDRGWEVQIEFLKSIFNLAKKSGLKSYLMREIPNA